MHKEPPKGGLFRYTTVTKGRMAFSDPAQTIKELGISEGARVADFGAGTGFYTLAAARSVGHDGKVYAIDIQPGILGRIVDTARQEKLSNVEIIRGDLEKPHGSTLADMSVDVVMLANIFFQAHHKDVLLREAFRVLRPSGRLLFVEWKDSYGGLGPTPEHVVTEPSAREQFEKAGFVFEQTVGAGDRHYGLIFRRPQ